MKKKLGRKKYYSEDFKKSRVRDYESGNYSVLDLSRLYGFSQQVMYKWIHKYSKLAKQNILIVEDHQSASEKVKECQNRIENLERVVGLKQLELDYLHKLIDTAQTEFGIDIKKNVSTSHLDTSWKTKNK